MALLRGDRQRLEVLLNRYEKEIREAFMQAIVSARGGLDVRALEAALSARDVGRAVELLRINQALLFPLDAAITGAYFAGGQMITEAAPASAVRFGFDGRHYRAEQWTRQNVGRLITRVGQPEVNTIRGIIEQQITIGRNPRQMINELAGRIDPITGRRTGGIIGLSGPQQQYVANARQELEGRLSSYFDRKLRDRRFDPMVRRAIAEGRSLTDGEVTRIVNRYSDRLLAHRAEVIARTESITALRAGRREGIQQAIEQGAISNDLITRRWDATMDKRTRPDHVAMHGAKIDGSADAWEMPDGSRLMYPGDTSLGADASQTTMCRCVEFYDVNWLRTANG